jgi:hypothetical protein
MDRSIIFPTSCALAPGQRFLLLLTCAPAQRGPRIVKDAGGAGHSLAVR